MTPYEQFRRETAAKVQEMASNEKMGDITNEWLSSANKFMYSYNFEWLGRPIIQYPQDIVAVQELIWTVKPDLIIETGIAHGGSLILSASMLALLDLVEALKLQKPYDPRASSRRVVGIDIEIRAHNGKAIAEHAFSPWIQLLEGSSIASDTIERVRSVAKQFNRVLVFLDSNHTHDHVYEELVAYAPLASVGSYCVVFDTIVEDLPNDMFEDRPWGKGNNPKTAVWEYLKSNPGFEIDREIQNKLQITVAPDGYLRRMF